MTDQKRKYFSGNTVEQAVMKAASHYGLKTEDLAYEQVEKKTGFLNVRRRVVVRVDPGAPGIERAAEEAPAAPEIDESPAVAVAEAPAEEDPTPVETPDAVPAPVSTPSVGDHRAPPQAEPGKDSGLVSLPEEPLRASEQFPAAEGELADAAARGLDTLLRFLGLSLSATILQADDHLAIELSGPDEGAILDEDGKLLLAIQHLLPRVMRGLVGASSAVRVNCDSFHEIREERLRDLAQRTASDVKKAGKSRTLGPMAPDERRIVHLTLGDDPEVETESRGEGYIKRVQIRLSSS